MEPQISVVIPIYKCEDFVERAVNSVLSQPCAEKIEILLVDDGSPDKCGEICDRLAAEHANIRVFHKENGGTGRARNLGIDNATGKYLAFLDADDWWDPNFFDDSLSSELSRPDPIDVYSFSWKKVNYCLSLQKKYIEPEEELHFDDPCFKKIGYNPHHGAFLYNRDYVNKNNFRYIFTKTRQDVPFRDLTLYFASSIKRINKFLYVYYQNMSSVLHKNNRMVIYTHSAQSLLEEKRLFVERGADYEAERLIVSEAVSLLPDWCATNRFKEVKAFTESDACQYLRDGEIMPWNYLLKDYNLWKNHPKWFWFRSRIHPGIALAIKRFAARIPFLQKATDYLYNRCIQKWEKYC